MKSKKLHNIGKSKSSESEEEEAEDEENGEGAEEVLEDMGKYLIGITTCISLNNLIHLFLKIFILNLLRAITYLLLFFYYLFTKVFF